MFIYKIIILFSLVIKLLPSTSCVQSFSYRFSKPHYAAEVYENLQKGKSVLTVEARGRSSLHYEIVSGNEDSTFVINPSTGNVMTQRNLDFERTHFYNLTVTVSNLVI
jgi:hypothetical protein